MRRLICAFVVRICHKIHFRSTWPKESFSFSHLTIWFKLLCIVCSAEQDRWKKVNRKVQEVHNHKTTHNTKRKRKRTRTNRCKTKKQIHETSSFIQCVQKIGFKPFTHKIFFVILPIGLTSYQLLESSKTTVWNIVKINAYFRKPLL